MFIYLIRTIGTDLYKIGVSKNPKTRLENLQTGNGSLLEIVHTHKTIFSFKLESSLHNQYKSKKTTGEWFLFTVDDVKDFKTRCINMENMYSEMSKSTNPFV